MARFITMAQGQWWPRRSRPPCSITWCRSISVLSETENYDTALNSARQGDYTYLFFPTITHWEDRATEWSGIPDQIAVKLTVIDLASGQPVSSATIEGTSGLATFGGDHPQDLLPEPLKAYVDQLFQNHNKGN